VLRAALVLTLLGGTLGVLLDAWHVASDTTRYAHPWIFGIATWTIPLFAAAGLGIGVVPVVVERSMGRRIEGPSIARAALGVGLFALAYLLTGIFRGAACAGVLGVLAVVIWLATDRPSPAVAVAHALAAGASGALVEMTLVHLGAFFHTDDRFFGVAPWLPMLYVCASLALVPLARALAAATSSGAVAASTTG
jgi:hypothetical protein